MPLAAVLETLVQEAWASLVGPIEGTLQVTPPTDVIAFVQISGSTTATLTIACNDGLARLAASTIFGLEPADVSDADIADAMGELANVVGGQLKPHVDPEAQLGLPAVLHGSDAAVWVPGAVSLGNVVLETCGMRIHAQILERGRTPRPTIKTLRTEAKS